MSWGTDLWDQWDNVSTHTQKGITFLETYVHFVKDRCQAETEYARNLRRLVKTYLPKKREEDDPMLSHWRAFRSSLQETGDLAGQHEIIAETLLNHVAHETHNLVREIKDDRKKFLADGGKLQQHLQQSLQQLEKAKKNYEKAFKEAEKAQENFHKADADLHLSRAEVEKQRMNASIKNHQCDDHKNEYANQLQKTNQLQASHYASLLPGVLTSLQEMEERRINKFQSLLKKGVECEKAVFPIIAKCLDGIVSAADSIDEKKDSEMVVEMYKSGFAPPSDIAFDDLSTPRLNGDVVTPATHPAQRQDTMKGTISASKLRKRGGIFGIFASNKHNYSFSEKDDFNELPPMQRKKKIQLKIDEVQQKLQQETATRDGLLKMKVVYEGNPSLGDPQTVVGQLNDSCHTIEKLRSELERYNSMLNAPEAPSVPLPPQRSPAPPKHHPNGANSSPRSSVASQRTSASDESLSRSASDSSSIGVHTQHNNTTRTPITSVTQSTNRTHNTQPKSAANTLTSSSSSSAGHTPVRVPLNTTSHTAPPKAPSTFSPVTQNHTTNTSSSNASSSVSSSSASSRLAAADSNHLSQQKAHPATGYSHSPESGIGLSRNSLEDHGGSGVAGGDMADAPIAEEEDDFYDSEPMPLIGTCTALYHFDATSEGSMRMAEGELMHLVEVDQGDGWTRVRRRDTLEEGFVPTTYIEVTVDNNC